MTLDLTDMAGSLFVVDRVAAALDDRLPWPVVYRTEV